MRFNKKNRLPAYTGRGKAFFCSHENFQKLKGAEKKPFLTAPFCGILHFREKVKLVRTGKINNAVKYSRKVIKAFTFHL